MKQVIITMPDDWREWRQAEYVHQVAEQIELMFLGGHVDVETHWEIR